MNVLAGDTDVITYFKLRLSADGLPATGLTITDLDLQYVRSGAAPAAKVDATALGSAGAAHTDNAAFEIDATDQPGLYRVDWPDAAFATGAREVILTVKHASIFTEELRVNLTRVPAALADWYVARIKFNRDQATSTDEWTVRWYKNGNLVTGGITSPTLRLVNRTDGTDFVAVTAMTQIGTTGAYKLDLTTTSRLTVGQDVVAVAEATIDGATRTSDDLIGRDSS
jgi:hypothetical protein